MSEIFSGMNSANPMEICDALGWSNNLRQEDLVGAIMTLCRTVTAQSNRIDSLCVEVLKLRGPGHGMTVAEEIAMTPNVEVQRDSGGIIAGGSAGTQG